MKNVLSWLTSAGLSSRYASSVVLNFIMLAKGYLLYVFPNVKREDGLLDSLGQNVRH